MRRSIWSLVRSTLAMAIWLGAAVDALAQGKVDFANIGAGLDAPFFDEQSVPLEGASYVAQLYYWVESPDAMFMPAGPPVPFGSYTNFPNGYFVGGTVELPLIVPGDSAWVQVRAWRIDGGTSFISAALAGNWTGLSEILFLPQTGGFSLPPTTPVSLKGLKYPGEPLVVQPPQSRTVLPGESTTLTVVASTGVAGFYQWYQQPSNRPDGLIPGATNATYTTPPLSANTTYWVVVTNSAGSTLSAPATLTVLPSPPQLSLQLDNGLPALTLSAAPGLAYRIDYRTNFTTATWTPLVELSLTTSPFTFTDPAASNTPARFYRAVPP
jgi:hypothetical protein